MLAFHNQPDRLTPALIEVSVPRHLARRSLRVARERAETHGWDAAFTRSLGRYTRLMDRPATLEQRILDVR